MKYGAGAMSAKQKIQELIVDSGHCAPNRHTFVLIHKLGDRRPKTEEFELAVECSLIDLPFNPHSDLNHSK